MPGEVPFVGQDQTNLESLPASRLRRMSWAGDEVLEALRVLGRARTNPVAQMLRHQGEFLEFDHYPQGDIYDDETGAQYYYHAHRPQSGEHGHFHTFLRAQGMPSGIEPAPYAGEAERPLGEEAISHLIAVSMDKSGLPTALFTTNRWVTGESYFSADDTIAMLDRFEIDHAYPCLATNQWITALLRLFRPQIETLLRQRDAAIKDWERRHPGDDVFEDRRLEITSELPIDIDAQIARVDVVLQDLRRPHTSRICQVSCRRSDTNEVRQT